MDRTGIDPRKLIGLLLALNLGVFLAGMALQHWSPAAQAPLVFNAEKISLLALPTASSSRLVAAEKSAQPAQPATPGETAGALNPRCLSWKSLDAAGLLAIQTHLKQIGIAANAYNIELENESGKKLGWWVFLPPLENGAALQARIDEVRRLGVTDYVPVRGGSMRNALSLGVFASFGEAREHATGLSNQGIKGVKYAPRPEAGPARLVFPESIPASALPDAEAGWPNGLQPAHCALP